MVVRRYVISNMINNKYISVMAESPSKALEKYLMSKTKLPAKLISILKVSNGVDAAKHNIWNPEHIPYAVFGTGGVPSYYVFNLALANKIIQESHT